MLEINEKQPNYFLSYADYLKSNEDVQYEVLDSQVISMSPAPTTRHQDVQRELLIEFGTYLRTKECSVYGAPIDVCLFAEKSMSTHHIKDWVQPDLAVVCDQNKITTEGIIGVPELVIEILSPSTARNDRVVKFNAYEEAGLHEYWIVDPANEYVEVFLKEGNKLVRSGLYTKNDTIHVTLFQDLKIDLSTIFPLEDGHERR